MKIKVFAAILCILLMPCLVTLPVVFSAVGISPTQGAVGTEVTVSDLTPGQSYTIKWGDSNYKTGAVSTLGTATFLVPESSTGSHNVNVESPSGTSVYAASFTIVPSITIDPTSGFVGTVINVEGTGFEASEEQVKVTLDGVTLKSGISANSSGSWETTITVPAIISDDYIIDAYGNNTSEDTVADRTFTVYPNIVIEPSFGSVGTEVSISGTSFASSETGISFTYDGTQIKSNISADTNGSWDSLFSIPQSIKGDHTIDAFGSDTSGSDVPDLTFSVSPGISVEPAAVLVGDDVNISGSGFANNEEDIQLHFDGVKIKSNILADSNGYWYTSFSIPESVNGTHEFDASGYITSTSDVKNAPITVEAKLVLKPAIGNIGENITIYGTGFSKSKAVTVDYGTELLQVNLVTDTKGSFNASFTPIEGMSGQINVQAEDEDGVKASATFSMETTPPELTRIASPKDGARVGYIGDTKVTFDWTDVSDPSGVFYELQISNQQDFSNTLLDVPKLTTSEYTLTHAESLAPGTYFWRVKAIDKAGNSSDWVGPFVIKTAFVDGKTLAIIIVCIIAFIIVVAFVPRTIIKAVRKKDNWSKDTT